MQGNFHCVRFVTKVLPGEGLMGVKVDERKVTLCWGMNEWERN